MNPRQIADTFAHEVPLRLRYALELTRLGALGAPVVELGPDQALADYLNAAPRARHGRVKTWLHRALRWFWSDFDINGLLGTYPMHVLSTTQFRELLSNETGGTLLDIGAGRGDVTAQLAALFDEVTVTETSSQMARRLKKAGYEVWTGDFTEHPSPSASFDVISLLNVLDRCDKPLGLLGAARAALCPGGRLVIALVLPYRPFVYENGAARSPAERLPISSDDFEGALLEFVDLTLRPLGLDIECVSRAPYLSGGDARRPLYELDDLIVVCRAPFEVPLLGA